MPQVNTTKFHNKKTGGITFGEAVPKGRLTLDRCLRDRASSGLGAGSRGARGSGGGGGGGGAGGGGWGRVMPGVVTRPPPVRPDADYRGMPKIAGFQNSFSITDRFGSSIFLCVVFVLLFCVLSTGLSCLLSSGLFGWNA